MVYFQIAVPGIWREGARIDLEHLKKTAAEVLKSEGEVAPVALLENPSGVSCIPIACSNDVEKRLFFRLFLPALIRATGTTRLGIVQEVWFYRTKDKSIESGVIPPSQHPDREEAVHILILTAEDMKGVMMTIVRDEKGRPAIGEVHEINVIEQLGPLRECIEALKDVAKEIPR